MSGATPAGFEVTWDGGTVRIAITEAGTLDGDLPHLWIAALPAEVVEISLRQVRTPNSRLFAWLFGVRRTLGDERRVRLVEVPPAARESLRLLGIDRFFEPAP